MIQFNFRDAVGITNIPAIDRYEQQFTTLN